MELTLEDADLMAEHHQLHVLVEISSMRGPHEAENNGTNQGRGERRPRPMMADVAKECQFSGQIQISVPFSLSGWTTLLSSNA
jgi:hypothetical protein